jgi:hypothetical protein
VLGTENLKGLERTILKYYSSTCLEGLYKTTKRLRILGPWVPPEWERHLLLCCFRL